MQVRDALKGGGSMDIEGYGDLSLTELLPALLTRYSETEMMIVAPTIPDQAAEIIGKWLRKKWARADGKGTLDVIHHLTIVSDLRKKKSPLASRWLSENPFGLRLTLIDRQQPDTVLLLPDFAITGPVNLQYGHHFIAKATSTPSAVEELWERYQEAMEPNDSPSDPTPLTDSVMAGCE